MALLLYVLCVTLLHFTLNCDGYTIAVVVEPTTVLDTDIFNDSSLFNTSQLSSWTVLPIPLNTTLRTAEGLRGVLEALANVTDLVGIVAGHGGQHAAALHGLLGTHHVPVITPQSSFRGFADRDMYPFLARLSWPHRQTSAAMVDVVLKFKWTTIAVMFTTDAPSSELANGVTALASTKDITIAWTGTIDETDFEGSTGKNITDYVRDLLTDLHRSPARIVLLIAGDNDRGSIVLRQAEQLGIYSGFVWLVPPALSDKPLPAGTIGLGGTATWDAYVSDSIRSLRFAVEWVIDPTPFLTPIIVNTTNGGNSTTTTGGGGGTNSTTNVNTNNTTNSSVPASSFPYPLIPALIKRNVTGFWLKDLFSRWEHGKHVMQALTNISFNGSSGTVKFDPSHRREHEAYTLINSLPSGGDSSVWKTIGKWDAKTGLEINNNTRVFWPSGSTEVPNDYPVLKGQHLKIAVVDGPPWVNMESTNGTNVTVSGPLVDFFESLADDLKFTYEYHDVTRLVAAAVPPEVNELVKFVGGSTSYDMLLHFTTINSARIKDAAFAQPYLTDTYKFIFPKPELNWNMWAITTPFSLSLWILIGAFILFSAHMLYFLESGNNPDLPDDYFTGIATSLWLCLTSVIGTHDLQPVTRLGKMYCLSMVYMGVILLAAYTANLAAHLTTMEARFPVSNLNDIAKSSSITQADIGVVNGSGAALFYSTQFPHAQPVIIPTAADVADYLDEKKCKVVISGNVMWSYKASHTHCTLAVHGEPLFWIGKGFAFRKDFPGLRAISEATMSFKMITQFADTLEAMSTGGKCSRIQPGAQLRQLDHVAMSGAFVILLMVSAVALLMWMFDWIQYRVQTFDESSGIATEDAPAPHAPSMHIRSRSGTREEDPKSLHITDSPNPVYLQPVATAGGGGSKSIEGVDSTNSSNIIPDTDDERPINNPIAIPSSLNPQQQQQLRHRLPVWRGTEEAYSGAGGGDGSHGTSIPQNTGGYGISEGQDVITDALKTDIEAMFNNMEKLPYQHQAPQRDAPPLPLQEYYSGSAQRNPQYLYQINHQPLSPSPSSPQQHHTQTHTPLQTQQSNLSNF